MICYILSECFISDKQHYATLEFVYDLDSTSIATNFFLSACLIHGWMGVLSLYYIFLFCLISFPTVLGVNAY